MASQDDDDAEVVSCTLLTCAPNDLMSKIHDRMPVLLPPGEWDRWLHPDTDVDSLRDLLVPAPNDLLTMHPVTTLVNSVRNKGEVLIAEASADQLILPEGAE
ncbi:MAG: SOS response-associated peptidase family protein [Acidimicrobiales bacterium]